MINVLLLVVCALILGFLALLAVAGAAVIGSAVASMAGKGRPSRIDPPASA